MLIRRRFVGRWTDGEISRLLVFQLVSYSDFFVINDVKIGLWEISK